MNALRTLFTGSAHKPNPPNPTSSSTFGLEFEFILVHPESEKYPYHLVSRALSDPIPFRCRNPACDQSHTYTLPIHDTHHLEKNDYSRWSVTYDISLFLDPLEQAVLPKGYTWSGIEVVTPILSYNQSTDHTIHWQDELSAVLAMLHRNLVKENAYPMVNHSTGLHLHIGNQEKAFFIDGIRGLIATFTALERQFESIMPPDRIAAYQGPLVIPRQQNAPLFTPGGSNALGISVVHLFNANVCQMLPDYFSEGNDSQDTSDPYSAAMNVPSWLLLIMRAPTVKRLIQRFHTSKGAMLNLDKADDHYPPEKQHIEVRPHTGSIDYAEVSAWVNLIISLLETCSSRVGPDELCTYLTASWKDPKYTLVDLASYVGASQSTQDFYGNMLSREYARRRYDAQMAKVSRDVPLHRFIRAVEGKRRKLIDRSAIDERIRCIRATSHGRRDRHRSSLSVRRSIARCISAG
ncbi:hypothetical protein BDV97DRAFT_348426 [Delphinella strobiligena]|nr:hypothetical protein BDV97DRAFT_348426 [Delphinella strobiligena]